MSQKRQELLGLNSNAQQQQIIRKSICVNNRNKSTHWWHFQKK